MSVVYADVADPPKSGRAPNQIARNPTSQPSSCQHSAYCVSVRQIQIINSDLSYSVQLQRLFAQSWASHPGNRWAMRRASYHPMLSLLCIFSWFPRKLFNSFNIQGRAIRPHRFIHRPRFNEKELPNFVLLARTNRPRCGHGSGRQWMEQIYFLWWRWKKHKKRTSEPPIPVLYLRSSRFWNYWKGGDRDILHLF